MSAQPSILILDSETTVCHLLKSIIQREFDVDVVDLSDGDEAFRHLQTARPILFTTDVMHKGMDTPDLSGWIRDHYPGTPVIIISAAFITPPSADRLKQVGILACLAKPVNAVELMELLGPIIAAAGIKRKSPGV